MAAASRRFEMAARRVLSWRDQPNHTLNDGTSSPGMRPLLEHIVSFYGLSDASDQHSSAFSWFPVKRNESK